MKTTLLLLLISINVFCQDIDLRLSKTDRNVITGVCTAGAFYTILKPGCDKSAKIQTGVFSGLAILAQVIKTPKYVEVNSSGINYKLRNKKFKCYVPKGRKKYLKRIKTR